MVHIDNFTGLALVFGCFIHTETEFEVNILYVIILLIGLLVGLCQEVLGANCFQGSYLTPRIVLMPEVLKSPKY